MDKKRKTSYFSLLLVLSVILLGSCHHRSEEDEMAIKMLRTATETMEMENGNMASWISAKHESAPESTIDMYKKSSMMSKLLYEFKSITNVSELDIPHIKGEYLNALDSLSKLIYPEAQENMFNMMIDSTFEYFDNDDELFVLKMRFDLNHVAYTINSRLLYGGDKPRSFSYLSYEVKSKGPLKTNIKRGEEFSFYFSTPSLLVEKMYVFIDSVTFNRNQNISYHLYQRVHVLDFDSTLKRGTYLINGKTVSKCNNCYSYTAPIWVYPLNHTFTVN